MMEKLTFRQRLKNTFIRPRQLILLDSHGEKPARNLNIRLISVITTVVVIIAVAFVLGLISNPAGKGQLLIPQHLQLQRQYDQLQSELAEANAISDLKGRQLESLKGELLQQQEENGELSKRLRMLESILEARKADGIQLIKAQAKWTKAGSLHYDFTLVKGGSYPRFLTGSVLLSAQSPEGETVEIALGKQSARLPFRIETHTFLRGLAAWEHEWHPDKLLVTVYGSRGKELLQMELSVDGVPK